MSQLSATISPSTNALLERYVATQGMDKSAVIEQALLHHLRATRDIPEDFLVPPRLVVPAEVGECMMARIQR